MNSARLSLVPIPVQPGIHEQLPDADPDTGIVVYTARPSRHAWPNTQAFLMGLGARREMYGAGRRLTEDLELITAWIHAYKIHTVVVRLATLPSDFDSIYGPLWEIAKGASAHLALTCDGVEEGGLAAWVTKNGGDVRDSANHLLDRIGPAIHEPHAAQESLKEPSTKALFPANLPLVPFVTFRARCKRVLTPAEFRIVDDLYGEVFRKVEARPFTSSEEALEWFTSTIDREISSAEAVTIANAARAAMFRTGAILEVNTPALVAGVHLGEHRRLTDGEIRSLRAYRTPWRSCLVVLEDAGLSRSKMLRLRLDQVSDGGSIGGVDLPKQARYFISAQWHLRAKQTVDEPDAASARLLPITEGAAREALNRVASDLELPARESWGPTADSHSSQWKKRLAVKVTDADNRKARPLNGWSDNSSFNERFGSQ